MSISGQHIAEVAKKAGALDAAEDGIEDSLSEVSLKELNKQVGEVPDIGTHGDVFNPHDIGAHGDLPFNVDGVPYHGYGGGYPGFKAQGRENFDDFDYDFGREKHW